MLTIVRAAALILTVTATAYMLQAGQPGSLASARQTSPSAPPRVNISYGPSPSFEHDYFVSRVDVVPLGRVTITLPILMYHYIRQPPPMRADWLGYKLSISPSDFTAQIDSLWASGYHTVDLNDVRAYFAGKEPLPSKPIVITFDDGYADLYTTAYPILARHRFKAVAYIVSGFVGRPGYVTAEQVVQLDHNGIEIASHTVDHADLARSSSGSTMRELVDSKHWLEQVVGHPVVDFAYPSGKFSPQVAAEVQQAGYDTAVTTMDSLMHARADRYTWSRIRVGGGESMADFTKNLGTPMPYTTVTVLDIE
jgi:peptidoglycan/xylan/chitin deacetylase (PgdA/CDA1 family)